MNWIKTSERLPELWREVRIIGVSGCRSLGRKLHGDQWHDSLSGHTIHNDFIASWQPLPEPPEVSE